MGASRRPKLELADIVREYGPSFRRTYALSFQQAAALHDIERCRTAALGGHMLVCDACGYSHPVYNSCRNRHCPKCQCLAAEKWIAAREARLLPTQHFHLVFTLPAELRALARYRPRLVFDALFASAAETLQELARDEKHLGAMLGVTAVLHTWTRDLRFHPHIHCIVTGGGLSPDSRWIEASKRFLFPVRVMGMLFRGKMLGRLRRMEREGALEGMSDFADPEAFGRMMARIAKKNWVVYAKRAFRGAREVYQYLGRYTHRVGIANSRLVSMVDGLVTFRTKDGKHVTLHALAFLGRFVQHVLPPGFVKIRHYGLLAPSNVNDKLVVARRLLTTEPVLELRSTTWVERLQTLTGKDATSCPMCGTRMRVAPLTHEDLPCARGPP